LAESRRNWSRLEVEATVSDYLAMLLSELRGEPYNKSAHRALLRQQLHARTDPAIERKHQNISAILIEMGLPYVEGYKPLGNYQELLGEVVRDRVAGSAELLAAVRAAVQTAMPVPVVDDILAALVPAPQRDPRPQVRQPTRVVYRAHTNYLLREALNSALGRAGELFALEFERTRLARGGHESLASRVEHVSVTRGDHEGFDILSFDDRGAERLIEVKTTTFGAYTPFFVSRNELALSQRSAHQYQLYRLFGFRGTPRLFALAGSLEATCTLEAEQYVARVN
jgi:hypothetical protein